MKLSKEELHAIRNELVMLGEAAVLACLRIEGPGSGFSLAVLNLYAQALSRRAAVHALDEDLEQFRVLAPSELEGGKFADGGRELVSVTGARKSHV